MPAEMALRLPRRTFWLIVILADLTILLLLPKILWVVPVLVIGLLALGFVRRVEWLLAFMLLGMPLLDPLSLNVQASTGVLLGLRLLFVCGCVVALSRVAPRGISTCLAPVLRDPRTLALLLLTAWIAIGLIWTEAPRYGAGKTKSFLLTGFFLFLAASVLWPVWVRPSRINGFLLAGVVVGGLVAAAGMAAALGVSGDFLQGDVGRHGGATFERLAWLGTNTIWLARILAVWIILLLWAAERRLLSPVLGGLLTVLALLLIVRTGSRGPLIALLLSPLALLLVPRAGRRPRRGLTLALVAGFLAAVLLILALPTEEKARLAAAVLRTPAAAVLGSGGVGEGVSRTVSERFLQDPSSVFRTQLARSSLDALLLALPWGTGTGGFSTAVFLRDFRIYPHNLEVEVLFENGLPGLLLLLLFLLLTWKCAIRLSRQVSEGRWLWVLFVMALLNAQVSGDLPLNEGIWFWGGMIVALSLATREMSGQRAGACQAGAPCSGSFGER